MSLNSLINKSLQIVNELLRFLRNRCQKFLGNELNLIHQIVSLLLSKVKIVSLNYRKFGGLSCLGRKINENVIKAAHITSDFSNKPFSQEIIVDIGLRKNLL